MIIKYKGLYPVANKISIFNHYKRISGRSLERDMQLLQKREGILNKTDASIDEINKALEIDPIEILQNVYYALRCAGEGKILTPDEVTDELDIQDLTNGSLIEVINQLLEVKKNPNSLKAPK